MNITSVMNIYKPKLGFTSTERTEYYVDASNLGDTFVRENYNPFEYNVKNSPFIEANIYDIKKIKKYTNDKFEKYFYVAKQRDEHFFCL